MKPSEFLTKPAVSSYSTSQFPTTTLRTLGQDGSSQEVSSTFQKGPLQETEEVYETTGADGSSISLKRIIQQQQTSSTSKVTTTRKLFQQKQQEYEG
jgi:hypothetical protein